jgi:serine protease Do
VVPASRNKRKNPIAAFGILQVAFCSLQFAMVGATLAQSAASSSLASREEAALKAAADSVAPSVVQIRTIGGLDVVDGTLLADGPTTGLVISEDGYILSSAFNFVQQPTSILVTLATGKQLAAELVATDHSRMLVLLKASGADHLPVPQFAPVDQIRVGQWAVAVGRTFRADRINVTVGIVSALGRMFGKAIQTDADVSTANYGGPLVDIRGRVLGLIVPMAPQTASEVAGAEWYDSGIGFSVPIAPLMERINRMKKGEDQRPGLLGIGMAPKNPHSSPATLAAVRPDSPAGQAGLKKGDRIVEVSGKPIHSQTDLRFSLGTAYGGDSIRIVAMRGKERIERDITLIGELPAFRHAFLGLLPMRSSAGSGTKTGVAPSDTKGNKSDAKGDEKQSTSKGLAIRFLYPGSPAADAGVMIGDRITRINESPVDSIDGAIEALNNLAPGNKVALSLVRGGQSIDIAVEATRLPTSVPAELPPASESQSAISKPSSESAAGDSRDLNLPESRNKCRVYVPASHEAGKRQAVLLWLCDAPDADAIIDQWRSICDRDDILLIVPSPADSKHWERTEVEYLRRLTARFVGQYKIDPHRVVVYGEGTGGALAWLTGLSSREVFRGLATTVPVPRTIRIPPNDAAQRFSFFAALPSNKEAAAKFAQGLQKASEAGYDVATVTVDARSNLSEEERNELARWIDTLDRF